MTNSFRAPLFGHCSPPELQISRSGASRTLLPLRGSPCIKRPGCQPEGDFAKTTAVAPRSRAAGSADESSACRERPSDARFLGTPSPRMYASALQDRKASGVADDFAALYNPLDSSGSHVIGGLLILGTALGQREAAVTRFDSTKSTELPSTIARDAGRGVPTEIHLFVLEASRARSACDVSLLAFHASPSLRAR